MIAAIGVLAIIILAVVCLFVGYHQGRADERAGWKKKTIIELLKQHLILMTHDEKIEHLKAIIPKVCPGVNVSKNPPKGIKRERKVKAE